MPLNILSFDISKHPYLYIFANFDFDKAIVF